MCNINFFMIMRKWTYLVAMLMLAGATTTFTGCIDTDEPAGIEELRGAKAELLRAKVAVEAALAAQKQADAALTLAQAKTEEAKAAYEQARAKQQEEIAKQEALRTELQAAKNEAEKARIEAEIAEAAKRKADAENAMAKAATQLEIDMKNLEASLLAAQQKLVEAEKNLKLAQTTLTAEQQAAVDAIMNRINGYYVPGNTHTQVRKEYDENGNLIQDNSSSNAEDGYDVKGLRELLKEAELGLFAAQKDLKDAMYAQEAGNFEAQAEMKVKVREYELAVAETTAEYVAELSKLDPATTDWEKEVADLNEKIAAAKIDTAKLVIEAEKLHADNKLAWDSVVATKDAFDEATVYTLSAYKNDSVKDNQKVIDIIKTEIPTFTGEIEYDEAKYQLKSFTSNKETGLKDDKVVLDSIKLAAGTVKTNIDGLKDMIETLKDITITDNDKILDSLDVASKALEDSVAKYDSIHKAAVAEWEILVAAKKGTKTEATEDIAALKKTVDAYNTEFNKLAPAVLAYNNAIDTLKSVENKVAVAAKDEYIAKKVAEKQEELYLVAGMDTLSKIANLSTEYNSLNTLYTSNKLTKEKFDLFIADSTALKAKITAKATAAYTTWAKTGLAGIEADAVREMDKAIKKDMYKNGASGEANPKSKIIPAYDALVAAWDVVYKAIPDSLDKRIKSWETAYGEFEESLNDNYGQILSTPQTAATMNIQKDTYAPIKLDKDGKVTTDATKAVKDSVFYSEAYTSNFGYITAAGSDIDSTEYAKMIASELDAATTHIAWGNKSTAAWGSSYADRMLPVAEDADNIGGTLKDLVDAKNDLAQGGYVLVAQETIASLVADLEAQLAVWEGEIAVAIADKKADYDLYAAKYDAYAALFTDINTKIAEAQHLIKSYDRVKNVLVGVIDAYYQSGTYSFTYVDQNNTQQTVSFTYNQNQDNAAALADFFVKYNLYAEYCVIEAETNLKVAEVALEQAKDGTYNDVAQKTIELTYAQAEYDAAKANYDAAIAELNALLASFSAE